MELALLPPIILAIAEQRSLDAVLSRSRPPSRASPTSRWPGYGCATRIARARCAPRHAPTNEDEALHLRASAGHARRSVERLVARDGTFHRVPLSSPLKIAHIASTGQPIRIDRLDRDDRWVQISRVGRARAAGGFAGRPLVFRGETLGVLGVFRRVELDDRCWEWLRTLSDAAAVAVTNARAFEEAESLRRALELERDYLREEVREGGAFGEILGRSPALRRVLREVDTVAATDTSVLILGESGTGKELVARAIHQRSRARRQAARQGELRLDSARAVRKRVLRPRARLVHRRGARPDRAIPARRTAARCFSTRSARFRWICRRSCCACCRRASSSASATMRPGG